MSRARPVTSLADRLAVLRVGHAATRPEQPFEVYAAVRLRVPLRRGGAWWLLEDDGGAPVSSCMVYPLELAHEDARFAAYGIGAVATHPDHRTRGHASRLCRDVVAHAEGEGRAVGVLFSAIPPPFYERLAFAVAPAYAWRATDLDALEGVEPARVVPVDGMEAAGELAGLYEAHEGGLHPWRDAERFQASCVSSYEDVFFTLGDPVRGYLRLHLEDEDEVEITEMVVPAADEEAALAFVFDLARRLERPAVVGWMAPTPRIKALFQPADRSKTQLMVRGHPDLDGAMFCSSDYF